MTGLREPPDVSAAEHAHPDNAPRPTRDLTIAVDATIVRPGQSGIASYTVEMTRALASLPRTAVRVFTHATDDSDWGFAEIERTSLRSSSPFARLAWRQSALRGELRRLGADVLFIPSPEPMFRCPIPQVAVVHDVGPLSHAQLYDRRYGLRLRAGLQVVRRSADAVVCVSEATRTDLLRTVPKMRADRLVVAGEGARAASRAPRDAVPRDGPSFALYVGTLLRHKNVDSVIRAFEAPLPGMPERLILVGPTHGSDAVRTLELAESTARVSHEGFVTADRLAELYGTASCVVLPTLHEGFGIPLVEAMKSGVPAVASDIDVLREVAGDAAFWVDRPRDPRAWQQALRTVNSDAALRATLVHAGLAAAEKHRWSRAATRIREVLAEVSRL